MYGDGVAVAIILVIALSHTFIISFDLSATLRGKHSTYLYSCSTYEETKFQGGEGADLKLYSARRNTF